MLFTWVVIAFVILPVVVGATLEVLVGHDVVVVFMGFAVVVVQLKYGDRFFLPVLSGILEVWDPSL